MISAKRGANSTMALRTRLSDKAPLLIAVIIAQSDSHGKALFSSNKGSAHESL